MASDGSAQHAHDLKSPLTHMDLESQSHVIHHIWIIRKHVVLRIMTSVAVRSSVSKCGMQERQVQLANLRGTHSLCWRNVHGRVGVWALWRARVRGQATRAGALECTGTLGCVQDHAGARASALPF